MISFHVGQRADEQHFVTLYLIFWSYVVNLTYIGVAIFVSMDFSDVWLAVRPSPSCHKACLV